LVRFLADIAMRVPAEHAAELGRDIRHALRTLRVSPAFTAVALLSLSLGVGVAVSAFSETNGLVFRAIPGVPHPEQLVTLELPTSYPHYRRYRERSDLFSSVAAYVAPAPFAVSSGGEKKRLWGHLVTPSYFSTLGVRPALGRFFNRDEEQPGRAPTVIVSYRLWQDVLGADPSLPGKTLVINGRPATVIGVGPKDFFGASPSLFPADLWIPVTVGGAVAPELADGALERIPLTLFQVLGRLQPGVTESRVNTELDAAARQVEQDSGLWDNNPKRPHVTTRQGGKILPIRTKDIPMYTSFLMVLASLVVLIACANVANTALARASERRREIAIRLALGASRARLIRLLLTEHMLIAIGAGGLGFLLAVYLMHLASQIRMPYPIPVGYDLSPDSRALWFTLGLTVLTGLGFGLAPAWHATRADFTPALKEGGDMRYRKHRRLSLRNGLMLSQMAGSLTLLLLVSCLTIGMQRRMGFDAGFQSANLYLLSLDPVRDGYSPASTADFLQRLLDRVKMLPSVIEASLTDTVPVSMNGDGWAPVADAAQSSAKARVWHGSRKFVVGRGYFETLGLPILAGRSFRKEDESGDTAPVIISEKLARECWNGESPLGRRLEIEGGEARPPLGVMPGTFDYRLNAPSEGRTFEVVGVAKDTKGDPMAEGMGLVVYFPLRPADFARPSLQGVTLLLRGRPGADVLRAVRQEVSAMDAGITPFNGRSMADQIGQFVYTFHVATAVYGSLGLFGLVLASVGLAGLTAYSVTQRRHEIGIRLALGAQRSQVLGLVMKEGALLVAAGTVLGLAGAAAGLRLLSAVFSEVAKTTTWTPTDSALLLVAPPLLAAVALSACYLPARQSTRLDPAVALREE
jgi:predicted permease